jgi:protein TonB
LIGPDDVHRKIVSRALMNSEAGFVREFNAYPNGQGELSRLMDQGFGVVMIDVDSDERRALALVESIAALGSVMVMVYSKRNDPDLLTRCMRAGAREFLPLPEEDSNAPAERKPQAAPRAPEPPIRAADPQPMPQARRVEIDERAEEMPAAPPPAEPVPAESADNDFNEWDKTWVMSAMPMAKGLRSTMRVAAPAEIPAKSEPKRAVVRDISEASGRAAEQNTYEERQLFHPVEDDQVIKPDRSWLRWVLIVGGLVAVVGIVALVLMRPSHQNSPAPAQTEVVTPQAQQPAPQTQPSETAAAATPIAKPSPQGPSAQVAPSNAPSAPAPASQAPSDEMNAQLAAPARISIKQPAAVGEAPDNIAPGALDSGASVPGSLFGSTGKAKVVPAVSAISAGVAEGMLIRRTAPVYPKFAQETHVGGTVVLKATITETGTIANVHVVSGPTILVGAAVDAVKTWRYRPYLLNNQPIQVETTIDVIFNMGHN